MTFFSDRVYDNGLSCLDLEVTHLHVCSSEPTTFAALTSLGSSTIAVPAPSARPGGGRRVVIPAVSNAPVSTGGTAGFYALTDATNSRLLVAAPLSATQVLTAGNTWSTSSFDVSIPPPA